MTHNKVPTLPKSWINVGDVNPQRHGGIFVKWKNDMWHIIETRHPADIPEGISKDEYMFEHMYMEPSDVWINGNPYEGFTFTTIRELGTFSNLPFVPFNPESDELPENETYQDYVDWYLSEEWDSLIGYLVHIYRQYINSTTDFSVDYWDYLGHHGIDKSEF